MKQKASKTLIGVFVLSALGLGLAAVVVFGSGRFFTEKYRFIMYFENSVSGLEVGAPVLFRGVPIGSVTDISIDADSKKLHFYIPVVVEILGGKVTLDSVRKSGGATMMEARQQRPEELLKDLIARGLRAQLSTQSFVTGQLAVSLDLLPDTPVRLVGDSPLPEIPTVPSEFEVLAQTFKQLPLRELVERLTRAVEGIERLVNAPETKAFPAKLDAVLDSGEGLMNELRAKVDPLAASFDRAATSFSDLAGRLGERADGLSASAQKTLAVLDATLAEGKAALAGIQKVVNPASPTVTDLNRALSELAAASRSIRTLADYLERHPEALLTGKGAPPRR